jgi:putative transposase
MQILRASLYRLEPTDEQALFFSQTAGACRFIYNLALEQRRDWHRPGRKITYLSQQSEITALRAEVAWLAAAPVHALQMAMRAVDGAFQRFFMGLGGYPQPRKKFRDDRFTLPDPNKLGFKRLNKNRAAVKLPKIGWVKLVGYRPLGGELRSVTIKRKAGHWYASIAWRAEVADQAPPTLPSVGLDRGVAVFAALSDGTQIKPLNAFKAIQDRLATAQRKLARKTKFSANWKKQKAKITRLHMRAANARKDFLQKLSTDLAKSHSVIKIEKLQIQNMTRSAKGTIDRPGTNVKAKSRLNRSILDQGWGMFATMLNYKLAERGGKLVYVHPAYTSQTCAECHVTDKTSRINQARFVCAHCGHKDSADVNGARNVHQARALAGEPPKRILRRIGKRKHPETRLHAS